jgi:DNA-binding response OmpR family regulator
MGTRKVILVADDEDMIRNFVRIILHAKGYEVLTAANGTEALELSRTHQGCIDLLLTDVHMPQMDGISAYRRICAERADMKVLFMSGAFQEDLPEPWPLVSKPFDPDTLLAKVNEILEDTPAATGESLAVILVVDQNENRKKRTKNILTENGYAVMTASSVEEAEAIADSAKRIDLIISEVMFPGDSGVHLAEREASDRNIDTLLISHFHRDLLNKVPGFSKQPEFLANPFTPEELLTRVRQLLTSSD